jgi:hypothetical protein
LRLPRARNREPLPAVPPGGPLVPWHPLGPHGLAGAGQPTSFLKRKYFGRSGWWFIKGRRTGSLKPALQRSCAAAPEGCEQPRWRCGCRTHVRSHVATLPKKKKKGPAQAKLVAAPRGRYAASHTRGAIRRARCRPLGHIATHCGTVPHNAITLHCRQHPRLILPRARCTEGHNDDHDDGGGRIPIHSHDSGSIQGVQRPTQHLLTHGRSNTHELEFV